MKTCYINIDEQNIEEIISHWEKSKECLYFFNLVKEILEFGKHESTICKLREQENILINYCKKNKLAFLLGNCPTLWDKITGKTLIKIKIPEQTPEEIREEMRIRKNS